jgi:aerobic carbon-monoxide dehydrogenase medium subunit
MKPAAFDYAKPKTVAEATALLDQAGASAAVIAGGQSLIPMLNLRIAQPDLLVDVGGLEELKETGMATDELRVGALTSHSDVEDGRLPDPFSGLMQRVASGISYRAVRNHGTIGGSVALADPAADWPVCLMALGTNVRIAGRKGTRSEPVRDFVRGQYTTSLEKDEIILGFAIRCPDGPLRWGACKVARKSGAFASSIAIVIERGHGGPASVALAGAGPRPSLLPSVAKHLSSAAMSDDVLRAAISQDLTALVPEADAYSRRLHASTILRAIREMRRR